MAIERRVTEIVGPVGGRLHTARSRNDQVATDVAMFVRAHARDARERIVALARTLIVQAERHLDWPMPGYTHLQRAQPVYLRTTCSRTCGCSSATASGSGVVAAPAGCRSGRARWPGVNFDTDRGAVAAALGFRRSGELDRRGLQPRLRPGLLSAAATCATHLSRLGAELVLWSSRSSGSRGLGRVGVGLSIMPQKKNPDAAELLRAKAPRLVANLVGAAGRDARAAAHLQQDMQEDKERLFDACDTLELCLDAADGARDDRL